jgi:hypothetical protein
MCVRQMKANFFYIVQALVHVKVGLGIAPVQIESLERGPWSELRGQVAANIVSGKTEYAPDASKNMHLHLRSASLLLLSACPWLQLQQGMKAKRSKGVPDRSLKQNQISIREIVKPAEQKGKNLGSRSGGGIFPRSQRRTCHHAGIHAAAGRRGESAGP